MEYTQYADMLKALGEDTRLRIFEMLRNGSLCACKILEQLNITQPTLSHHMKVLCDCGIVTATKDWKWTYYAIDCDKLDGLLSFLGNTKCRKEKGICE